MFSFHAKARIRGRTWNANEMASVKMLVRIAELFNLIGDFLGGILIFNYTDSR